VVSVDADFSVEAATGLVITYGGASPLDGELLIGDTGVGFVTGELLSGDASVTITKSAGGIDLSVPAAAETFAINTLLLADDVADAETVTIGADVYEVEIVNTDSTDNTANSDFDNTTNPLVVAGADVSYPGVFAQGVGDLVRIETEIMRITAKDATDLTFQRGVSGTAAATHADALDIFIGDGIAGGSTVAVGLVTTLTPAVFNAALLADINAEGTEPFTATADGTKVVITADVAGVAGNGVVCAETLAGTGNDWVSAQTFGGSVGGATPYKVYSAVLTQASTDPPVATVLQNTLSGVPVWGYTSPGLYTLTLTGEFTADRTFITHGDGSGGTTFVAVQAVRTSANVITITVLDVDLGAVSAGTPTDGLLVETAFQVIVFD
jgi:hypothetical protein